MTIGYLVGVVLLGRGYVDISLSFLFLTIFLVQSFSCEAFYLSLHDSPCFCHPLKYSKRFKRKAADVNYEL